MSFANSPSCLCCDTVCNVYSWKDDSTFDHWDELSGTWDVVVEPVLGLTVIECTASGELEFTGLSVPTEGYFAIIFRGDDPDQTIAIKLSNATHDIVMKVTLSETGVDEAGTLSVTVDSTEQYTTLPKTSDLSNGSFAKTILLQCIWTATSVRVEVELIGYTQPDTPFVGIGTEVPINWVPDTISLVSNPLSGTVTVEDVVLERLETDDEVCTLITDCANRDRVENEFIPRSIGARIGSFLYSHWDANRYVEDAAITGDPTGTKQIFAVRPHSISITEDVRASGYIVFGAPSWVEIELTLDTWVHIWSLFIDGDTHELRQMTKLVTDSPFSATAKFELYRGTTLLGTSGEYDPGGDNPANYPIPHGGVHIGNDRIAVRSPTDPSSYIIESATVTTFGGEWIYGEIASAATEGHWENELSAVYCAGPVES